MFLKCRQCRKDGKIHRSWSIVESRRYAGNKVAHRHVLYPGEINDSQRAAWERTIEAIDERDGQARQLALFPADRTPPPGELDTLQVRLSELRLCRPRQRGACRLADHLWRSLRLDGFFGARLPQTREGTDWEKSPAHPGHLPADLAGLGMAAAPAMVRGHRHGRSAGSRCT